MTLRRLRTLVPVAVSLLVLLDVAIALIAPAAAVAMPLHPTLLAKGSQFPVAPSFARAADGTLHVVFETNINWGNSANGVGAVSISASGHVGPQVQALNWGTSGGSPNTIPGLAILSGGALEATFTGSPSGDPGPWGISSTNDGSTWSAPADLGSGSMESGGGQTTLQASNGTPVLTDGCCGGITVQQGFGTGSPTYQLTNNSDDVAGLVDTAVDAASGADIATWDSSAGSGGQWLQQIASTEGTAIKLPEPSQYGSGGTQAIVAGRDSGPGVFTVYPANWANTTRMGLYRYGGGTITVGSLRALHADNWGVATGPDGRIWVVWAGVVNGKGITAVTRSNKAVTRFEPIQRYAFAWSGGITLSGDGRLGPLDMLVDGTPSVGPDHGIQGIYYARIQAELSAKVSVKKLGGGKFKLKVKVTDAGDAISGALASAKGQSKATSSAGKAKLVITGSSGQHVTVDITALGYQPLRKKIKL